MSRWGLCLAYTCPTDTAEKHKASTRPRNVDAQHGAFSALPIQATRKGNARTRFPITIRYASCMLCFDVAHCSSPSFHAYKMRNAESLVAELACERGISYFIDICILLTEPIVRSLWSLKLHKDLHTECAV